MAPMGVAVVFQHVQVGPVGAGELALMARAFVPVRLNPSWSQVKMMGLLGAVEMLSALVAQVGEEPLGERCSLLVSLS